MLRDLTGEYSAASAYGAMFFGSTPMLGAKIIWKTAAPPKARFFFWLAIHERCWTADRRFRHSLQQSNACIICDQAPETLDHLLCGCCLARQAWHIWILKLHLRILRARGGGICDRLVVDVQEVDPKDPAARFRLFLHADGVDTLEGTKCENVQRLGYERCPANGRSRS